MHSCPSQPPDVPVEQNFPQLTLETTAFTQTQLIHSASPQVALAGRSNVGKSSLINVLAGRRALAKVSSTPGKTRSINYYRVGNHDAFLVDLPGYGYARCSKQEQQKWAVLLEYYLQKTSGLGALLLLLDSRLTPQVSDRELLAYARGLSLRVVPILTKADKCSKRELQACEKAWRTLLGGETLIVTSAKDHSGIPRLWGVIRNALGLNLS